MRTSEAVTNKIIALLNEKLPNYGYQLSNNSIIVEELGTFNISERSDMFSKRGYAVRDGGVFVYFQGLKNKSVGKFTSTDELRFVIIPFFKSNSNDKLKSLTKLGYDCKEILQTNTISGGRKLDFLNYYIHPIPAKSNDKLFWGTLEFNYVSIFNGKN